MIAIKINNLTKNYKDLIAVDNLNLEITDGELFSLLGVNGAGKTTTIKMLTCLTKPTSGDAIILGYSIKNDTINIKKIVNISPQETAIAPNLTVEENLEFIASIYNIEKGQIKEKVSSSIALFKLDKVKHKRSNTLSGGWQRRLSIAMALISEPKILFLDEPTLGLDVLARRELWEVISSLKGKVTIILTTHYMEEAEMLSDHIGIMADGRLIDTGTPSELIAKAQAKNFEDAFVKIVTKGVTA